MVWVQKEEMGEFKFFGWHAEDSLRQATPLFSLLWTNSAVSTGSHYLQPSLSNLFFTSCQSDLSRTYLDHITSLFKTFPGFLFGPKLKSWASNRLARLSTQLSPMAPRWPRPFLPQPVSSHEKQLSVPQKWHILCCLWFSLTPFPSARSTHSNLSFFFTCQVTGHFSRKFSKHSLFKSGLGAVLWAPI